MYNLKPCFHRDDEPCYRFNCKRPKCRQAKLRYERTHMALGIVNQILMGNSGWFITFYPSDPYETFYDFDSIDNFQKRISKLLKKLKEESDRDNQELFRVRVNSVKTGSAATPYQLHAHLYSSYVPNPIHRPTPDHHHHYVSEKLNKEAGYLGLTVWIEHIQYPEIILDYLIENLESVAIAESWGHICLPAGFNRISYSHNWPKMEYQKRRTEQRVKRKLLLETSSTHPLILHHLSDPSVDSSTIVTKPKSLRTSFDKQIHLNKTNINIERQFVVSHLTCRSFATVQQTLHPYINDSLADFKKELDHTVNTEVTRLNKPNKSSYIRVQKHLAALAAIDLNTHLKNYSSKLSTSEKAMLRESQVYQSIKVRMRQNDPIDDTRNDNILYETLSSYTSLPRGSLGDYSA